MKPTPEDYREIEDVRQWIHFTRNSDIHAMSRIHMQELLDIIDRLTDIIDRLTAEE